MSPNVLVCLSYFLGLRLSSTVIGQLFLSTSVTWKPAFVILKTCIYCYCSRLNQRWSCGYNWLPLFIGWKVAKLPFNQDNPKKNKTTEYNKTIGSFVGVFGQLCNRSNQIRIYVGELLVPKLCDLEPLHCRPCLLWHADPANVPLQMIRLDKLLPLQGTSSYWELNRSTVT